LDVGSVHGLPGVIGALAIGFFASTNVNPISANGVFYGGGRLLWVQVVGVAVTIVWTVWVSLSIVLGAFFAKHIKIPDVNHGAIDLGASSRCMVYIANSSSSFGARWKGSC
jgi:ammonia channel protein AmtB